MGGWVIGVGFELAQGGLVDLANPLAGQAKLFTDLCAGVVIEVNCKEVFVPVPVTENLSRRESRNLSTASCQQEVLGLRISVAVARSILQRVLVPRSPSVPSPFSIARHGEECVVRADGQCHEGPSCGSPNCVGCLVTGDLVTARPSHVPLRRSGEYSRSPTGSASERTSSSAESSPLANPFSVVRALKNPSVLDRGRRRLGFLPGRGFSGSWRT